MYIMERRGYKPYSPEERKAIRDDVFTKLETGVCSIQDSESFQKYLSVQAKFHHYSWSNSMLILMQRPDASLIAPLRKWNEMGRRVIKGERGIRILAPSISKDEETGEKTLKGFVPVAVWDVTQTEGEPLPEPKIPKLLEGDAGGTLFDALLEYAGHEMVQVRLLHHARELHIGANGEYRPRTRQIRLRPNPMSQMTKTLAHELSHHVHIQYFGTESDSRSERETVAEASAYVVSQYFGLDSGDYSFPYLAGWAANRDQLKSQLSLIQKVSSRIIDGLNS